jgi:hypothetical protein
MNQAPRQLDSIIVPMSLTVERSELLSKLDKSPKLEGRPRNVVRRKASLGHGNEGAGEAT